MLVQILATVWIQNVSFCYVRSLGLMAMLRTGLMPSTDSGSYHWCRMITYAWDTPCATNQFQSLMSRKLAGGRLLTKW